MNERQSDFEWLRQFAREGNQSAFRDLVRRHLDLVFATALHKTEDAGGAEEIAQNVFAVLARKSWSFAADDSLPAWLHKTALLESKKWVRGELRRRRRESAAAELGTTMKTTDEKPAFSALVPLLDEALLSLREKDRAALLLRFYEKQSLRDVGASLGVSEDTAQKRVATALEKLSDFFQRRGFRTASAVAAGAALQQTAATASTATFTLVANTALEAAPPALAGLSGWLARLASLTKAQTALFLLGATAVPVAWQLNEQQQARQEFLQTAAQLSAARAQFVALQEQSDQLRASSTQLEVSLADAGKALTQNAGATRAFEDWKQLMREQLLAADYHWPDDSPFVRIPKSALPSLDPHRTISRPGELSQEARELLGLTPGERAQIEDTVSNYFTRFDSLVQANMYETNQDSRSSIPASALAGNVWVVPALGNSGAASAAELESTMGATLGPDRWPLVESLLSQGGIESLRDTMGLDAARQSREIALWVDDKLKVNYLFSTGDASEGFSGLDLKSFAPGTVAAMVPEVSENLLGNGIKNLPGSLSGPIVKWVQDQAARRVGKETPK